MKNALSLKAIMEQFKSEWVLIENPQTDKGLIIKHGVVLWHSKDRDEVYRKARDIKPKHSAILYTGKIPEGEAVVL